MTTWVTKQPGLAPLPAAWELEERYEILDGQRVELPPMSAYAGVIASRLHGEVHGFVRQHDLGQTIMETLVRLALPVDRNRRPDVAFVSYQRWPKGRWFPGKDNAWDVVPELAAEVISPNDMAEDLLERIDEYFRAGVQLVWVIYPRQGMVHVYESCTRIQGLTRTDTLDGGIVLPGFKLPLTALFVEEPAAPEDRPS